ncbi:hypothetical protein DFQ27_007954 [Actinomortierella ambigua]|uniref:Uncharacterized protein n=1 Tax=Actinomortierella ambigua TaxID=1343610 RepID=A0A9P6PRN3_9FUNG|nr:hypothetical protein DFQ27_007954 [Actinomortierella ambigua]
MADHASTQLPTHDFNEDNLPTWSDFERWNCPTDFPYPPEPPAPGEPTASKDELVSHPFSQGVPNGLPRDPLEVFRDAKWHGTAIGTILTHSGKLAHFFPAAGLAQAMPHWNNYITKVSTFPGFFLVYNTQTEQTHTSVNIELMLKHIQDAYEGVMTVDIAKVRKSIESMASSIRNRSSREVNKAIFAQSTVVQDDKVAYTTIFYTKLQMKVTTSGKKTYESQSYAINRSKFKVLGPFISANAKKLAEVMGVKPIDEWNRPMTSPTGSQPSCFDLLKEDTTDA